MNNRRILIVCTTDSMIWNFLVPHIRYLQARGFVVECACSITGEYFSKLKSSYDLIMHKIPFQRFPFSMDNLFAFFRLKKLLVERGINIVFCHEPVGGAIGRIAGKICNCKVIYMAHGFHFYKGAPKRNRLYYYIEKWLSKYTDCLITINEEDYEAAKQFKANKVIKINGIGVDTTLFKRDRNDIYLRRELNIASDELILLSVGELIPRKNHIAVIDALNLLKNPKIHYVIAGEGPLRGILWNKIAEYHLEDNIHLLGYRRDINKLCNSVDIFVLPSIHEGLSVALMEAMACGLPIIASRIRGNIDLIDDGKGGLLVTYDDLDDYIKAIRRLVCDKNLRRMFGVFNTNRVKDYDIVNVLDQMANIWFSYE